MSKQQLQQIISLRHELHQFPELSNEESKTAKRITDFISRFAPDEIIEGIGGNGVAAIYDSKRPGPVLVFRSELDALPIAESIEMEHASRHDGLSHKCGHDGHMSIVAGMAPYLQENKITRGKAVLFFQPAEETGEGAARVIKDKRFKKLKPDHIIGLHNLPGYYEGTIVVKNDTFAAASKGMTIALKGATSHAAHPENGRSPAPAIADLITGLNALNLKHKGLQDFALLTIIYARLGEKAFGTMPGEGEIALTLRAFHDEDLRNISSEAEALVSKAAEKYRLSSKIGYQEIFPATINKDISLLKTVAKEKGLDLKQIRHPFRWSEDFGHYSKLANTMFFGIGAGLKHPQLHSWKYDFPDKIIEPGIKIMNGIVEEVLL